MNARVFRLFGAVAIATLLLVPAQAALAQRIVAPSVTPRDGVPGVRFTFTAPGFVGAVPDEDADENTGERISYWINLPDGTVISTEKHVGKGADDDSYRPLLARANGYGEVTIRWTSPGDAMAGPYSLVMHGLESNFEVMLPFTMHSEGWQTVLQTDVRPTSGVAGTTFQFVATGFEPAAVDDDNTGERVAYWFNTPDGKVIGVEKRSGKTPYGNETKPLLHEADGSGTVNLVWSSPKDLKPGVYSIVIHGLDSHHEVLMPFSIK
jgi:hypothetical protein